LAAVVLKLAAASFFDVAAAGLVAAVEFGLDFLGQAIFLVTFTLGSLCARETG
jgi:hypothetical protein